jgi:hypothetical protein
MIGNQNARKHYLTREMLVELYERQRLPIREIARRTGSQNIHRELVKYEIPRRSSCISRANPLPPTAVSTAETAYAAGFFDGEGSINIRRPGKKPKCAGHKLVVSLAQTVEAPLLWLRERWGGSITRLARPTLTWEWSVSCRLAGRFLQDVLPFLIVKRKEAEVAIAFQSRKRNTGRRTDQDNYKRDAEDRQRLHSIRVRGMSTPLKVGAEEAKTGNLRDCG